MNEIENDEKRVKEQYYKDANKSIVSVSTVPYGLFCDYPRLAVQSRENAMMDLFWEVGFKPKFVTTAKIFDAGCGNGNVIRDFLKYGAKPSNCYGIDLIQDRIWEAQDLTPNVAFTCGNAINSGYPNKMFDLVICFTVFSSIFLEETRLKLAEEIKRVGRYLVFYDMNEKIQAENVKGLSRDDFNKYFTGKFVFKSIIPKTVNIPQHTDNIYLKWYEKETKGDENVCFVSIGEL